MAAKSSRAELDVIRWLCYGGFFACLIWFVITLSARGEFAAPLVGTIGFGVPTILMYVREHDAEQTRESARAKEAEQEKRGKGTARWNVDDSGDPTVPPAPPTRPNPMVIEGDR